MRGNDPETGCGILIVHAYPCNYFHQNKIMWGIPNWSLTVIMISITVWVDIMT